MNYHTSTICAIATAPGVGGIAVIRVSGPQALAIVAKYFSPSYGTRPLSEREPRKALYGLFSSEGQTIDDVVVLHYPAPNSYTGEEVVEISCHGSTYICQRILSLLLEGGCEMARPGEFTQRAYLNGRMNLSEAEAVADIIASQTEAQHRMAQRQMRGGYTEEFRKLREELLRLTALMELELDFSEEDVEFADRRELLTLLAQLEAKIAKLKESFRLGNAIKQGIPVAIVGATNVGKSTLLNTLLGEERAIVSDIHGTTRDSIEDSINIGGFLFRFVDTAGLRQTSDSIEAIGIERSYKKMQEASIRLLLIDLSRYTDEAQLRSAQDLIQRYGTEGLIVVLNKRDALGEEEYSKAFAELSEGLGSELSYVSLSARSGEGLEELHSALLGSAALTEVQEGDIIVSNARHQHLLGQSLEALARLSEGLSAGLPTDLLTQDLRLAISHIGEVTGEAITSDAVLHHIFAHFCIGK